MLKKNLLLSFIAVLLGCVVLSSAHADSRIHFVNNNGVEIAYTTTKKKKNRPAIVFIHGFPMNHNMFECQVRQLRRHFQVVTMDLRGFGDSDKSLTIPYTYPAFASDVQAVVNKLKLKKPVIAGLSVGSVTAEYYAATNSNISKLILLDAFDGQIGNTPPTYVNGFDIAAAVPIFALLTTDRAAFNVAVANLFLPETCKERPELVNKVAAIVNQTPTANIAKFLADGVIIQNIQPVLPNIRVPTLIMTGVDDPLMNINGLVALLNVIPNSRLVQFPGGHVFNITQADQVNRTIYDFIRENPNHCDCANH
jgi:pimeloyl-ACP methyl ester carboxylesterase